MLSTQKLKVYVHVVWLYVLRLRDIRFAGQVLFVIVVLLVSWSGIKAIDANFTLQKQIAALQQQNEIQQLENTNLSLENTYYSSDQYLELAARQNFGLGKPGEIELVVPKNVALSYVVVKPHTQTTSTTTIEPPAYQRNIQAWVDFFLHRH